MTDDASPARPIFALIVAAGRGVRAGDGAPKQYRDLAGVPVLRRAVQPFVDHPRVTQVQVVIHLDNCDAFAAATAEMPVTAVMGGASRQTSVRNGLRALASLPGAEQAVVLIHDAARPLLSDALLGRCIAVADQAGAVAAVPALPIVDSLRRGGVVLEETVERTGLLRVQTPQCFDLPAILAAHERWADAAEATDDAAVAMAAGHTVAVFAGEERNFKLTDADDFARAEALLGVARSTRTGSGFDVHAFEPGDHVWIGGIRIPHAHGLKGHSDADVALHALTDALLGAIAAGDIGDHFPPSDPQWRGAASDQFLEHARDLVTARGGRIEHVDVTIICEAPRIGPHRAAMRTRIAGLLRLGEDRISVKATTTERLGFTGRGEGIAAQAMATVSMSEGR